MKTAVQIGTNTPTDSDPLWPLCLEGKFDYIHLIEPSDIHNDAIAALYDGYCHEIHNIAITPDPDMREARLYDLSANTSHNSLVKRLSHPWREGGGDLRFEMVPCMTLGLFCDIHKIQSVDLLCIDTEGLDSEIILSIDFVKIQIKEMIWETWDHEDDDENGVYRTGIDIHNEVLAKLEHYGYTVSACGIENLRAVKEQL